MNNQNSYNFGQNDNDQTLFYHHGILPFLLQTWASHAENYHNSTKLQLEQIKQYFEMNRSKLTDAELEYMYPYIGNKINRFENRSSHIYIYF